MPRTNRDGAWLASSNLSAGRPFERLLRTLEPGAVVGGVDEAGRQVDYAIALNVLCLVVGRRWMKAFTELIGAAFSLVFFIEFWHAFPFEFPGASFDWALIARFVIGAGIVGSVVGIVVQLIMMIVPRTQRRLN